jgi:hypothetical protein
MQDGKGYVFSGNYAGVIRARTATSANLAGAGLQFTSSDGGSITWESITYKELAGKSYLYACAAGRNEIVRILLTYSGVGTLTAMTADTSLENGFNSQGKLVIPPGSGCRGVAVADDGTVYYSGATSTAGRADFTVGKVRAHPSDCCIATFVGNAPAVCFSAVRVFI